MPTYDYECDACGHTFEEFQSMTEEPLKKCPQCKKKKLRRLLGTGAAIIFKGSGFYQTDYRSDSYKSAAKADEAKPAATGNGTSDTTKPAATDGAAGAAPAPAGKSGGKKDKSAT
jgi:putative FmdB family regulatory protein